ncbi:SusC/RagA family TonB-linked outer membrane protein [Cesiribacter andamanensis]|uniref:SusC/RagA family TonB-linked outer membrane protein n=1 Tax=Cesiribacter andamanensis TaxID=649507 RepID=UPI000349EEE3|nr:TonB-dependent receptor [Cesiribacter andamanensis]
MYAQEQRVTGTVRDAATNEALPGVAILIKGTSTGTVTDMNGGYAISAPGNATLVFSFIGYSNQEVPINNRTTINVQLREDIEQLSEVVVVGYGVQEKRDATGAVESVKAEDFNQGVISSPEQLIQGKSAGVQITQASGEPGSGINIRIRGTSSVRGGNNPLFVVDGVPLAGDDVSAGGVDLGRGSSSARNPLNFLNPNDIASIDILKDASATAIYGSRGANGVVLITTKSGRGKKQTVEYGTQVSFARQAKKFDLLDRDEFLYNYQRLGGDPRTVDFGADTDWQDEISRTAVSQKHDLSYANAYKTGDYRVALGWQDQVGIIRNSGQERLTGRLNWNQSFLNDRLNLGIQGTVSRVLDENPYISDNAGFEGDLIGTSLIANPTWAAYPRSQYDNSVANPLAYLEFYDDNTETDRQLLNASLDYDIIPGLNFRINGGYDNATSERIAALSNELFLGGIFGEGRGAISQVDTRNKLFEALLNYEKSFTNSKLTALLGYSYQQFNRSGNNYQGRVYETSDMGQMTSDLQSAIALLNADLERRNLTYQQYGYNQTRFFVQGFAPDAEGELASFTQNIEDLDPAIAAQLNLAAVTRDIFRTRDELQSFFGRVNYSLNDKYLFTGTLRADGSTKFGKNNRYGYFPSAAFKWRLSEEAFIPANVFDDLSLRIGYGVTGNQEIPHNLHRQRQRWGGIGIGQGGQIQPPGLNDITFTNDDLQWEQTSQLNLGLDFGFFAGRFNGSLDFYRKNTTDLLFQINAPAPSPVPFFWQNLDADVINQGVELILNWIAIDRDNFGLDLSVNGSYNHNELQNLAGSFNTGGLSGQGLTGAFVQKFQEGQPLNAFYLREFQGFDPNGLNIHRGGDIQSFVGKSPLPKYNAGFNATVRYKNWDLAAYLYGQFGHYVYNNTANAFFSLGALRGGRNITEDALFTGENPANAAEPSTRFLEKGDFVRFQNLNLGYTANLGDGFIKGLRIFASGQNLFVITEYSGLDPEVNTNKGLDGFPSAGIDYTAYPRARTVSLGLNVTF